MVGGGKHKRFYLYIYLQMVQPSIFSNILETISGGWELFKQYPNFCLGEH